MFFMYLFYLGVIVLCGWLAWKWIFKPIIEEKERKKEEAGRHIDEAAAAALSREAALIGTDIQKDLDKRLEELEEVSAKLNALRRTAYVAERLAMVKNQIAQVQKEIGKADAEASAADGPISVDEDGAARKPSDQKAEPVGSQAKVARAKK